MRPPTDIHKNKCRHASTAPTLISEFHKEMFTAVYSQLPHHGTPAKVRAGETRQRSPPHTTRLTNRIQMIHLPVSGDDTPETRALGRVSLLPFEKPPYVHVLVFPMPSFFPVEHLAESHAPKVWTSAQHLSPIALGRQDVTLLHSLKMENQNFFSPEAC